MRTGRIGAIAAAGVVVLVLAAGVLSWTNYRSADQWRQRATEIEAVNDRLAGRNDELADDLAALRSALRASQRDVRQLEERIGGLAEEKARVADEREVAVAASQRLAELASAYREVTGQLDVCIARTAELASMFLDLDRYVETGQTHLIDQHLERVRAQCERAQAQADELGVVVDALAP